MYPYLYQISLYFELSQLSSYCTCVSEVVSIGAAVGPAVDSVGLGVSGDGEGVTGSI